jgi:hypothetical protein
MEDSTYPNVAADPIIYCPSVRSMPLGPGPKRTMLVKPANVRRALIRMWRHAHRR